MRIFRLLIDVFPQYNILYCILYIVSESARRSVPQPLSQHGQIPHQGYDDREDEELDEDSEPEDGTVSRCF